MDLYTETSFQLAKQLTVNYSTSFSKSSQLFNSSIRHHIFAIYGLVRVADEIVDTYKGTDATAILDELESHTMNALVSGFSPNPLVHAFVTTARQYGIDTSLIAPFFKSMRMDLTPQTYIQSLYETYIHGSAEVIGLMCLKVFCDHDSKYKTLETGAKALGAAYQKVNFLRDMKADFDERGRVYFPNVEYETFDDIQKDRIIADIKSDFEVARLAVAELPANSRQAVSLSFALYSELLAKLEKTSADKIKKGRVSVSSTKKLQLLMKSRLSKGDL
jgi:phytoene synthase